MKIEITIEKFNFKDPRLLIKKIKKKFILSPWIVNTLLKIKFKKNYKLPIKLVEINLKKDLKINKPTYLNDIHKKMKKFGYDLVQPEIAIYSCIFIDNKKPGNWMRFATPLKGLVDDDLIPHLPKLGFGLGKKFIETYWAYKNAVFHPHNNFMVKKNDSKKN